MDFATHIAAERERLSADRLTVQADISILTSKMDAIDQEMAALDAYEAAKNGKPVRAAVMPGQTRARRGSKRQAIIDTLSTAEGPMRRSDLLRAFGLKGDKSGEMSISNALTALTKSGQVLRDEHGYRLAA